MVFSSSLFLFGFLPAVLFLYFFAHQRYRNFILLLASLLFYAWGEPKNVLIMLASILVNYVFGIILEKRKKLSKLILALSVIYNVGVLFYFKYFNFVGEIWTGITGYSWNIRQIALPIGISFFTFQIMSYVIDVYRGTVPAQKNLINLALYISLFPQLIAGPIVRYIDVEAQIKERTCSWDKAYEGVKRFAIGFSKKVLIADQMALLVDSVFGGSYPSIISHWVGIIAYSLQIYYDFSGYSDMAIGLGKIFGFDFLENFNYPYIAKSVKEFWRRWHISLSSWFRDYLYIPLGGNRKGTLRTYINLLIVFFVTGLWHGASFNFIIWGLFHGLFLIIERLGFGKVLEKTPKAVQHLYTLLIVMIAWVFFRADTLNDAILYLQGMIIPYGKDVAYFNYIMDARYWFFLIAGLVFAVPYTRIAAMIRKSKVLQSIADVMIIFLFIVAICYMLGSGYSPFLYFRF